METYDDQASIADVDSGDVDSPQPLTPVQIAKPEADGSFFAQWFKVVDPNASIQEDQYFGRSGWALSEDNFADERSLDAYLKSDHVLAEDKGSDPLNLSLDEFVSDDESEVFDDWSKMPPLLPSLEDDEPQTLATLPLPLERQTSDWTQMPDILPPLPLEATLSVPDMTHKTSDYVYVVPQVAQLPPQSDWNSESLVDVEHLQYESVVPYHGQNYGPTFFPMAQANGLPTGQVVPLQTPVYQYPSSSFSSQGLILPPVQPVFQNKQFAVYCFGEYTTFIRLTPSDIQVLPWNNDMLLVQLYYQCVHLNKLTGFHPGYAIASFPAPSSYFWTKATS